MRGWGGGDQSERTTHVDIASLFDGENRLAAWAKKDWRHVYMQLRPLYSGLFNELLEKLLTLVLLLLINKRVIKKYYLIFL